MTTRGETDEEIRELRALARLATAEAYAAGQRRMRERAARAVEARGLEIGGAIQSGFTASAIRGLDIEAEP